MNYKKVNVCKKHNIKLNKDGVCYDCVFYNNQKNKDYLNIK